MQVPKTEDRGRQIKWYIFNDGIVLVDSMRWLMLKENICHKPPLFHRQGKRVNDRGVQKNIKYFLDGSALVLKKNQSKNMIDGKGCQNLCSE